MQKANGKIFSALKMIEALYLDNKISYIIYRNILKTTKISLIYRSFHAILTHI